MYSLHFVGTFPVLQAASLHPELALSHLHLDGILHQITVIALYRAKGSIRLATLHQSEDYDAPISITLEIFHYSEVKGSYKALSYCWGAPCGADQEDHEDYSWESAVASPHSSILCNNHALVATRNLREALLQLRRDKETDKIWIDAICVNQSDGSEKAAQIPLMADVYNGASKVIVWLGRWMKSQRPQSKC